MRTSTLPTALPTPRLPQHVPALRWGVLGTGWIAERFVTAVRTHTEQRVTAVASRNATRASGFADDFGIPASHGSYDDLVARDDIDVVYVASRHEAHAADALLAIRAGKHVLVEKPFALSQEDTRSVFDAARTAGVLAAEALWTFFLPKWDVIRQLREDGVLGEIRQLGAEYGEHFRPPHRILDSGEFGGDFFDLGLYPVGFATWWLDEPVVAGAHQVPYPTGVSGATSALLTTPATHATISSTIFETTPTRAWVAGTRAVLDIDGLFCQPGPFVLRSPEGGRELRWEEARIAHEGLHHQASEIARAIGAGELQTPIRTPADTVATVRVMDDIRRIARATGYCHD